MRVVVLLHAAAVVGGPQPLHPADRDLISGFRRLGLEVAAVELVGATGVGPRAMNDALTAGADRGVRVVAESLGTADAHATGLVVERALAGLDADLMIFASDADPEGVADVPAVIAWRLGAAYIPGVVAIGALEAPAAPSDTAAAWLTASVVRAGALVKIDVPPKAVVGIESDAAVSAPARAGDVTTASDVTTATHELAATSAIRILTLLDLGLEATLVRRGYDQRGLIEPASRPLVTTRSVESLVTLLR